MVDMDMLKVYHTDSSELEGIWKCCTICAGGVSKVDICCW